MRGGAIYGMGAPLAVGALEVTAPDTSTPVNSATGATMPDIYAPMVGSSRRRGRKSRGRKMRGGATQMGAMKANAGFAGDGAAGLANYRDVGAPGPGTNPY